MQKTSICFATNNPNKLKEVRGFLEGTSFQVLSLTDIGCTEEIPETSDTIEGNSLIKAQYVFDHYHLPCFADDTGLEVKALSGEPGVRSARFAGEHRSASDNNDLLLERMKDVADRIAVFKTVITWISKDLKKQFTGIVKGEITTGFSGVEGFGYDPLFRPEGFEKTFAEMTMDEKNMISHRALATAQLIDYLTAQK